MRRDLGGVAGTAAEAWRRTHGGDLPRLGGVLLLLAAPLLLAGPLAAQGAAEDTLTLDAAVAAALGASPAVASARAGEDRAAAAVGQARSAWLPSLSVNGSAVRFEKPMVVAPLHGFDLRSPPAFDRTLYQGDASLGWLLFDGGARAARVRRARETEAAAGAAVSAAAAAQTAAAAKSYLRVRSSREVLAAAAARVRALAAEEDRAGQMFHEGKGAQIDLVRAEAALARARADSVGADAEADAAERELARAMDVPLEQVHARALAPVRGQGAAPDRAVLLERALGSSPELARARRERAAAEAGRSEARAAWLPRLQTLGRYNEYGSASGSPQGEWQGGVQLSYPLFTGGARASAVDAADAEARSAAAAERQAERDVARSLDAALVAWRSAAARTTALEAAVRQSREVVRIETLSLNAGAGTQTDYLAAEAALYEAEASLTGARYALLGARIDIARSTGELSPRWLALNLESTP